MIAGLADHAARVVDVALEVPVGPSFTRVGYDVRSRVEGWQALSSYDLRGRVVVITGATSGLGLSASSTLAASGAQVLTVGRDSARVSVAADVGDLDAVRRAGAQLLERAPRVDVLIHNAGALSAERRTSPDGIEQTVAAQVFGPFLLTSILLPALRAAAEVSGRPSRVLTMSSGGMYAVGLPDPARLQLSVADYDGTQQYALAKRAQVTLNEEWARRHPDLPVRFHALHPGWADTPGVATSLPTFRRVLGRLLRTPGQGADTMVWLAADDGSAPGEPLGGNGQFWHDRRVRSIHKLPTTSASDTPARRDALWAECERVTGRD